MSREFETLQALMAGNYEHDDHTWNTVALMQIVDLFGQYFDVIDDPEPEEAIDQGAFAFETMNEIYEVFHSILVHQTIPMTEAERIAEEDQIAAELRTKLDSFAGFKILNLQADQDGNLSLSGDDGKVSLDDLFQPKKEEDGDEK